jgi:hypothetical protein
MVSRKGSQHGGTKVGEVRGYEDGCTKQMGGQGRLEGGRLGVLASRRKRAPHNIDRFADKRNNKCKRWNSRYWTIGGEAADAFTQDWRGDNNWLVPPLRDIPRVLMYLKKQNARGTILVPLWRQWWWPLMMRMATNWMVLGQRGPEIFQRGESGSIEPLQQQVLGMGVSESEVKKGLGELERFLGMAFAPGTLNL